jgi:hypothetical protein
MEELFKELATAGVTRSSLDLAWDFTVASMPAITGRLLSMRDKAFAALGDRNLADLKVEGHAPEWRVVSTTTRTPAQDPYIARQGRPRCRGALLHLAHLLARPFPGPGPGRAARRAIEPGQRA